MEITCIEIGSARLQVGGSERLCAAGTLALYPADQPHALHSRGGRVERSLLCVDPERLAGVSQLDGSRLFNSAWLPSRGLRMIVLEPADRHWWSASLSSLRRERDAGRPGWRAMCLGRLAQLWVWLERELASHGHADERQDADLPLILRRATRHIDGRIGTGLDLAAVAAAIGVSREHLGRSFRRYLGMGFRDYLQRQRIAWSRTLLLAEPDSSIMQIALSCGFSSASHFAAVFRARCGCTPSQYRRMQDHEPL